jgi:hypothetical protein
MTKYKPGVTLDPMLVLVGGDEYTIGGAGLTPGMIAEAPFSPFSKFLAARRRFRMFLSVIWSLSVTVGILLIATGNLSGILL